MKKIVAILGVVLFPLVLSACGNDNESACKDFVNKVQDCGGTYAGMFDDSTCEAMNDADCDVSGYFDCWTEGLGECVDGGFPNADTTAISVCMSDFSGC